MKYCCECGAEMNNDSHFCPECGAPYKENQSVDYQVQPVQTDIPSIDQNRMNRIRFNQMGKVTEPDPSLTMLVEYCTKTVATVGGDGYTEWVLYKREDDSLQLDYFSNYIGYENEIHSSHSVTNEIWDKINQIKEQYDLNKPTLENMPGMCGGVQLVKIVENDKVYRLEYGKLTEKQNEGFWLIKDLLTTI